MMKINDTTISEDIKYIGVNDKDIDNLLKFYQKMIEKM